MKFLRRLLWLFVLLAVLYVGAWVAGFFLISREVEDLRPQAAGGPGEVVDVPSDTTIDFKSKSISGFPLGYTVKLDQPSLSDPRIAWKSEDSVTVRWSLLKPFSGFVDYSGTHIVAPALQTPVTLKADKANAVAMILPQARRIGMGYTAGEGASLSVAGRTIFTVESYAAGLESPYARGPGDIIVDAFGFALSDDPAVQARYQEALQQLGNAQSMLQVLGVGLDRPIDRARLRLRTEPYLPTSANSNALRAFASRGGNIRLDVADIAQGQWKGRLAAHAMFGPDGRLMVQTCPLIRAGAGDQYISVPFMDVITIYAGEGGVDISRSAIPDIALPKTVQPFEHQELCNRARAWDFEGEIAPAL